MNPLNSPRPPDNYHHGRIVQHMFGGASLREILRPDGTLLVTVPDHSVNAILSELNMLLATAQYAARGIK